MTRAAPNPTRYWVAHALVPALSAALLLLVFEHTSLDRASLDPFFDAGTRAFPLKSSGLFNLVFRDLLKQLVIGFGALVAVGLVASFVKPALRPWRRTLVTVLLSLAIAPLTVALFKYTSCKHCPWDLDLYGGHAPYAGLLGCPPPGFGEGHCFPSGHASGGFALFALYFAHRVHAPVRARVWLLVAALYGTIMGIARMMQGAHFLSHTLATGFVCWFVCLVLYEVLLRRHDERRFGRGEA